MIKDSGLFLCHSSSFYYLSNVTVTTNGHPTPHHFLQCFQPLSPDATAEALTIQTYETFSTVSILLLDLAESLDDRPRHLAMAIYRMSELGLMLVERSLANEMAIKTT